MGRLPQLLLICKHMSLYITSLNSGSNGNCYYIGNHEEAVLVDAGISCRETERRMGRLGLQMEKVKAVFISHEHTDHIAGLPVLARKYQLPVYITAGTLQYGRLNLEKHLAIPFQAYQAVQVGGLSVTAFPKFHDANDPHSFVVESATVRVGIFTDIGKPCDHLINHFQQCHAAFLEANYDEEMLMNGRYPIFLKNRIRGGLGHLSNTQALELFTTHRPAFMSHLLLSHLSKDNNNPQLVQDLFNRHTTGTEIVVASRFVETPVYHIQSSAQIIPAINKPIIPAARVVQQLQHQQLSLF
jgi:phosphoribosyl 1,2-cyclic phosphodiesterase